MHFDFGGLFALLLILGWAAWSYLEDREYTKKRLAIYDLIHKERLYAMEKGLPCPEMPLYELDGKAHADAR